ncbi:MAG: hypothetical protein RSB53_05970 [Oscillospiraceae bacterium]
MTFPDKLIFLMELTSTSNKQLAAAIQLDPSLISRLRSGKRNVPQNAEYIQSMAAYFAKRCSNGYKLQALEDVLGNSSLSPNSPISKIADTLAVWLSSNLSHAQSQSGVFLRAFDRLKLLESEPPTLSVPQPAQSQGERSMFAFYGNEGKRRATQMFVRLVLAAPPGGEIKLLTDEPTDWIWTEKEYSGELAASIAGATARGDPITRIVPRTYDLSMAFDTVTRWLPLYMTGQVHSYYYPHLRDNIYNRTLYVVNGVAALVSTSIGQKTEGGTTFLTTDPAIVASYNREFDAYLALCKPATKVYDFGSAPSQFRGCISDFYRHYSDCIVMTGGPSFISTPPKTIEKYAALHPGEQTRILRQELEFRRESVFRLMESFSYTEIYPLASFEDIVAGRVRNPALEMFLNRAVFYTPEEYRSHLQNTVSLLESNPRYQVVLSKEQGFESAVYTKDGYRVLILRSQAPFSLCMVEYSDMVNALWEYSVSRCSNGLTPSANKMEVISKMKQLIRRLGTQAESRD